MLNSYINAIESTEFIRRIGNVTQFYGLVVESNGPDVFLGEQCEIYSRSQGEPVPAEVVGIRDGKVLLMPFGELNGIRLGSEVIATGQPVQVSVGDALLGRVIDAFGNPLDGKPKPVLNKRYPLYVKNVNPLNRPRINQVLETGVKTIDSLLTLGRGQRVGIFAGSGVGKSTLLGMIARNMNAEINVIALIGERGREVLEFIEDILGSEGLARSVVVVATSDQPALVRTHAALAATTIAEYFRDQGLNVVLTMDSITRFAMAQREIGLAIGEPPTARGYTPSVFAALPKLLERGGTSNTGGSITALYTVLVEGDDDVNDPVADNIRAILDGHILLSRELANHRHYPAIDILHSNSRLIHHLLTEEEQSIVDRVIRMISVYEKSRDLVEIGAYKEGINTELDKAIQKIPAIEEFLKQGIKDKCNKNDSLKELQAVIS